MSNTRKDDMQSWPLSKVREQSIPVQLQYVFTKWERGKQGIDTGDCRFVNTARKLFLKGSRDKRTFKDIQTFLATHNIDLRQDGAYKGEKNYYAIDPLTQQITHGKRMPNRFIPAKNLNLEKRNTTQQTLSHHAPIQTRIDNDQNTKLSDIRKLSIPNQLKYVFSVWEKNPKLFVNTACNLFLAKSREPRRLETIQTLLVKHGIALHQETLIDRKTNYYAIDMKSGECILGKPSVNQVHKRKPSENESQFIFDKAMPYTELSSCPNTDKLQISLVPEKFKTTTIDINLVNVGQKPLKKIKTTPSISTSNVPSLHTFNQQQLRNPFQRESNLDTTKQSNAYTDLSRYPNTNDFQISSMPEEFKTTVDTNRLNIKPPPLKKIKSSNQQTLSKAHFQTAYQTETVPYQPRYQQYQTYDQFGGNISQPNYLQPVYPEVYSNIIANETYQPANTYSSLSPLIPPDDVTPSQTETAPYQPVYQQYQPYDQFGGNISQPNYPQPVYSEIYSNIIANETYQPANTYSSLSPLIPPDVTPPQTETAPYQPRYQQYQTYEEFGGNINQPNYPQPGYPEVYPNIISNIANQPTNTHSSLPHIIPAYDEYSEEEDNINIPNFYHHSNFNNVANHRESFFYHDRQSNNPEYPQINSQNNRPFNWQGNN